MARQLLPLGCRLFSSMPRQDGCQHPVELFDTVSTSRLPLSQLQDQESALRWYTCGPTVYDKAHLGHARAYLSVDLMHRILQYTTRTPIQHLMGMTDVDDKIIIAAAENNMLPIDLARKFEEDFHADMTALGVRPAAGIARVSEHIPEIIDYARRIEANGFAYVGTSSGSLYFDTTAFEANLTRYERLVPRESPCASTGSDGSRAFASNVRSAVVDEKRSVRDFVLWKSRSTKIIDGAQSVDHPSCLWDSPWGSGRPGWHLECSTMCQTHFGRQLDVHAGGIDLCFPHHANEIAQALAYHNDPALVWPRCFLHVGHLYIEGRKMSKSLKNFTAIGDFLSAFQPDTFRLFCLLNHYRSRVDFSEDRMLEAANILKKYEGFQRRLIFDRSPSSQLRGGRWSPGDTELLAAFVSAQESITAALIDDFDTPTALHNALSLISRVHSYLDGTSQPNYSALFSIHDYLTELWSSAFGFSRSEAHISPTTSSHSDSSAYMEKLHLIREQMRSLAKTAPSEVRQPLFSLADQIREDVLKPSGHVVHDRK